MQNNDMAAKRRVEYDGEEITGLVYSAELSLEDKSVVVPEFSKERTIGSGVTTIPVWEVRYKIKRGTNTLQFFRDWHTNKEVKDVMVINVDAHGVEYDRISLPECECLKYVPIPEADTGTPTYAQVSALIAPYDVIPIEAG